MSGSELTVGGLLLEDDDGPFLVTTADERESTAPRRTDTVAVFGVAGATYGRPVGDVRQDRYTVTVFGDRTLAGDQVPPSVDQLRTNLAAFRRACRPRHDGLPAASFTVAGVTYTADVLATLAVTADAATEHSADLSLEVPAGMWQAATPVVSTSPSSPSTRVLTVAAATAAGPSTLDLFDAIITLTGTATTVRLEQDDRWLEFTGGLGGGVVLDCATLDADRDGDPVHGLVARDGAAGWMPVSADGSDITIVPTGGSVEVSVEVRPAW